MARGNIKEENMDDFEDLQETKENFFKISTSPKSKNKRFTSDPWLSVTHRDLFKRKASVYNAKKNDIQQITTLSELIKKKQPKLKRKALSKRKAVQVDTVELSVSQLVKIKLKDYNSIEYRLRVS